MSPRRHEPLDPAPFRAWVDQRLTRPKDGAIVEAIGGHAGRVEAKDLAGDLGISERRLYAWRFESQTLERIPIEEALHRAGYAIWEIYEGLDDDQASPDIPRPRRGDSLLSDEQLRVLHRFHCDRGVSIRELGRQVWQQAGYASPGAAEFGIRRGFKRLHLPALRRLAQVKDWPDRCCKELKTDGAPCGSFALRGDEYCWPHHPDNREEVVRRIRALAGAERVEQAA